MIKQVQKRKDRGGRRQQSENMPGPTSWQDYVDNTLVGSGYAKEAAIYGSDRPMRWGASKDFDINTFELKALMKAFLDSSEMRGGGMFVNHTKFTLVISESDLLLGRNTSGGCVVVKCYKSLVVCTFEDPYQQNCCNLALRLATYLKENGF